MTKSVLTRVASLFLVFVIALGLIPGSVFGVTEKPGNNADTVGGGGAGSNLNGTLSTSNIGMRFSLYWGENKDSFLRAL